MVETMSEAPYRPPCLTKMAMLRGKKPMKLDNTLRGKRDAVGVTTTHLADNSHIRLVTSKPLIKIAYEAANHQPATTAVCRSGSRSVHPPIVYVHPHQTNKEEGAREFARGRA